MFTQVSPNTKRFTPHKQRRTQPQQQQQQTHKLYAAQDNPVSSEMFVALMTERLLAVEKDRKAMEQRVRDNARQMGKSFHEIMVSLSCLKETQLNTIGDIYG